MSSFPDLHDSSLVNWGQGLAEVAARASGQVYLATPYTKRAAPAGLFDWARADVAAADAAGIVALLASRGITAMSPIVVAHHACDWLHANLGAALAEQLALDAGFWTRWCAPLLAASRFVYVPSVAGWHESAGVAHEVASALECNKPVLFGATADAARKLGVL